MTARIVYEEAADADLDAIYRWIADRADPDTALQFVLRLRAACEGLADFPHRGTPHDDLVPGLRSIPFERRATIAYLVRGNRVLIARVLYAGRDLTKEFAGL